MIYRLYESIELSSKQVDFTLFICKSYFINLAVKSVNKALVYIKDCNPNPFLHSAYIFAPVNLACLMVSRRRSDYRLGITKPEVIVLVKILKCLPIIKIILLKFTVVKSLKLNKNTEYASESPTKFAFAILLHVCLFSFWERKVNNLHTENKQKIENKCGREILCKIIHRSKGFGKKLCLFLFIFCTQKQFINRRFAGSTKARFFYEKNKHFYIFYLQNFVN